MRTRATRSGEPTVDVRFCLVFPRESLSVPVMRRVLGDTLASLGVDQECIADLLLAVTEACTNVLRHSGPGRRYEVVAHVGWNRCVVEVLDSGRGFDPASLADRRHNALRQAGRRQASRRQADHRPAVRLPARPAPRLRRRHQPPPAEPGPPALLGKFSRARRTEAETAIAQLPESGRGMAIMRACVDDVTLRSGPGRGTVVSLGKRIEWRTDAPLTHLSRAELRDAG
jgi:anti-sigma regulatory factor (Ser/Thr protein kinase)